MEQILSFSISGIYSLLLLNLTFNFLLAIRLNQVSKKFVSAQEMVDSRINKLNDKIKHVEDSFK
ncbi:MAG: hypothetical protein V3T58_05160 [Candidatus Hydrothermarchaeales archaeon]